MAKGCRNLTISFENHEIPIKNIQQCIRKIFELLNDVLMGLLCKTLVNFLICELLTSDL